MTYGRTGGNNREGGAMDVVTALRLRETNPTWQRSAQLDGWNELLSGNPTHQGYGDREVNVIGMNAAFELERIMQRGIERAARGLTAGKGSLSKAAYRGDIRFLQEAYQLHPSILPQLRSRVFAYQRDVDAGIEGIDLHVTSTLQLLEQDAKRVKASLDVGSLEAALNAEKELGNNPNVLRQLSMKRPQGGAYIVEFRK